MYFYENMCRTRFNLALIDIDFAHLVQNAKDFGLVQKDKDKVSKSGEIVTPYRCLTMAGTPCIQICVDNEQDNSVYGKQFWDLKKALKALVSKQKLH